MWNVSSGTRPSRLKPSLTKLAISSLAAVSLSACSVKLIARHQAKAHTKSDQSVSATHPALATLSLDTSIVPTVDGEARTISVTGLSPGRLYSYQLLEDGSPASGLECPSAPAFVNVARGGVHINLA